jgi:hypothetical protein
MTKGKQEIVEDVMDVTTQRGKNVLIEMKKNKIQVWQEAVDRSKVYLAENKKRLKEAQRELKKAEAIKIE